MIAVSDAIRKIKKNTECTGSQYINVEDAISYSLAEDVYSPINMPPFDQSAMDGYAVNLHDSETYRLIGEVKAGDNSEYDVQRGEAVRIFTGAMVPAGANTIIKQEDVERSEGEISVQAKINIGANIRYAGEQIKIGELAIEKNTHLNPGTIGFLSMLGSTHVSVFRKPKISIITTGSELTKPGNPLKPGGIYESNSTMLYAALSQLGLKASMHTVEDDYEKTRDKIDALITESDLTIITGGISVGDYDFVSEALNEIGVEKHFYKVKQKPGKPLFYGTKGPKSIFALPGNPAAVMSCFYIYVMSCLNLMMGRADFEPNLLKLRLSSSYKKTAKMSHFLKGLAKNGEVTILKAQSSAMLSAYKTANCLIQMDEGKEEWLEGDEVTIMMLP